MPAAPVAVAEADSAFFTSRSADCQSFSACLVASEFGAAALAESKAVLISARAFVAASARSFAVVAAFSALSTNGWASAAPFAFNALLLASCASESALVTSLASAFTTPAAVVAIANCRCAKSSFKLIVDGLGAMVCGGAASAFISGVCEGVVAVAEVASVSDGFGFAIGDGVGANANASIFVVVESGAATAGTPAIGVLDKVGLVGTVAAPTNWAVDSVGCTTTFVGTAASTDGAASFFAEGSVAVSLVGSAFVAAAVVTGGSPLTKTVDGGNVAVSGGRFAVTGACPIAAFLAGVSGSLVVSAFAAVADGSMIDVAFATPGNGALPLIALGADGIAVAPPSCSVDVPATFASGVATTAPLPTSDFAVSDVSGIEALSLNASGALVAGVVGVAAIPAVGSGTTLFGAAAGNAGPSVVFVCGGSVTGAVAGDFVSLLAGDMLTVGLALGANCVFVAGTATGSSGVSAADLVNATTGVARGRVGRVATLVGATALTVVGPFADALTLGAGNLLPGGKATGAVTFFVTEEDATFCTAGVIELLLCARLGAVVFG